MKNLEKTKKLAFELFIPFCFDVFAIQSDLLTWSIFMTFYSFVMSFFL